MAEPYVGEIRMFAGNFPPRGWAFCDGQLLAVSQNDALFALIGTIYGGDGRTTFGLPDMRGRVPVHAGSGPGLSPRSLGSKGGADTRAGAATTVTTGLSVDRGVAVNQTTVPLAPATGPQHPRLGIHFIIALVGIFPSRN